MSDIPDSLVYMTEFRHLKSIFQNGLLPGGGNTPGAELRNVNHFLPINALLLKHERVRPTANVALVLSKATLAQNHHTQFCLSKNGHFLTWEAVPASTLSLAWNMRQQLCFLQGVRHSAHQSGNER